jgi:hypothetical protein
MDTMKTNSMMDGILIRGRLRTSAGIALAAWLGLPWLGQAAAPTPVVDIGFTESEGATTAANVGTLGGLGYYWQGDASGYPILSPLVPQGTFAPSNNARSLDMGSITEGEGDRAVDLVTAVGPAGTLGAFTSFTLTGWINARDLNAGWGGNRIMFALETPDGSGFDLVQLADGSLQLGINQWPDGSPAVSSPGKVTADPETGAGNWVFYAVTYDSALESGQVKFHFGKPDVLVSLDAARSYARGPVEYTGELTLGNFGIAAPNSRVELGPNGPSRVFRGLIDEVKVFDRVLELAEIQEAQLDGAVPAVPASISGQPESQTVFSGQSATFSVVAAGTAPIVYQWETNGVEVAGATDSTYTLSNPTVAHNGLTVRVKVENVGTTELWSETAVLTVIEGTGKLVAVSFSDIGTIVNNTGDLGGTGTMVQQDEHPAYSVNVPAGSLAPAGNTVSMDFGAITEGQGGRAIDFTNPYGGTLGPMDQFTVTGWLNIRDLGVGFGGNRIAFALASPAGPGFDLVHLADGSLQLGVNQWPDGSPAQSSAGLLTADPAVGANNWVFVAVTYDGLSDAGNVGFYVGNGNQAALLDSVRDYPRGPIFQSGFLTLGNFGTVVAARNETGPAGGSRVLRGLMDEIQIFNRVLTLAEIQAAQSAEVQVVVDEPELGVLSTSVGRIEVSWDSTGEFQLQVREDLASGDWSDVTVEPVVAGSQHTVTLPIGAANQFFRLRNR